MENYILSLIKENNRVIIPNFGAFIVAKENGFSVLFNNFLSFNDGLLVDHIVEMEDTSKEKAEEKINAYVEKVKGELDENGQYTIAGLGKFTKDTTGILRFEQDEELSSDTEPKATTIPPVVESDELLDIDSSTEPTKPDETTEASVGLTDTTLNESTPIAEVEDEQQEEEEAETPSDNISTEESSEPKEEKDPIDVANRYLEEDNSKRNRSIAIFLAAFILLPLIGFSIYFFLLKDNSPAKTKEKIKTEIKKPAPKEIPVSTDAGTIDAGPVDTTTKTEPTTQEPKTVVTPEVKKPHQLIVGSFSTEANANKMIEKLNAKGYDQCFWFMHNNRYLVSLESFAKVYKAQARQEEILQSDRMESWIITKRQ